jgi:hypothetical protein
MRRRPQDDSLVAPGRKVCRRSATKLAIWLFVDAADREVSDEPVEGCRDLLSELLVLISA